MDEILWILLACQGDLDSFNCLVLTHQDLVFRQAIWMLDEPDAAEKVTQKTFLLAYHQLRSLRDQEFRCWLLRITNHLCLEDMNLTKLANTVKWLLITIVLVNLLACSGSAAYPPFQPVRSQELSHFPSATIFTPSAVDLGSYTSTQTFRDLEPESKLLIISYYPTLLTISSIDGKQHKSLISEIPMNPSTIATLSPDGEKIAYISDGYLYIQDISTAKITQVNPERIRNFPIGMGWDPNEKRIAFSCQSKESKVFEICAIDIPSGRNHILTDSHSFHLHPNTTDGAIFGNWSADGTKIVFTLGISPEIGGFTMHIIQILDVATGKVKTVLDEGMVSDISGISDPAISPDGLTILFSGKAGSYYSIFRISIDGSHYERITPATFQFDITHPVWNPNGTSFVTYAQSQNGPSGQGVPTFFSLSGKKIGQLDFVSNGYVLSWKSFP